MRENSTNAASSVSVSACIIRASSQTPFATPLSRTTHAAPHSYALQATLPSVSTAKLPCPENPSHLSCVPPTLAGCVRGMPAWAGWCYQICVFLLIRVKNYCVLGGRTSEARRAERRLLQSSSAALRRASASASASSSCESALLFRQQHSSFVSTTASSSSTLPVSTTPSSTFTLPVNLTASSSFTLPTTTRASFLSTLRGRAYGGNEALNHTSTGATWAHPHQCATPLLSLVHTLPRLAVAEISRWG